MASPDGPPSDVIAVLSNAGAHWPPDRPTSPGEVICAVPRCGHPIKLVDGRWLDDRPNPAICPTSPDLRHQPEESE